MLNTLIAAITGLGISFKIGANRSCAMKATTYWPIHLNPVRAKVVATPMGLDHYPWSGYSTVMGKAGRDWMDTDYILSRFGVRKKAAREAYHRFVAEGMAMGKRSEFTGGGDQKKG